MYNEFTIVNMLNCMKYFRNALN